MVLKIFSIWLRQLTVCQQKMFDILLYKIVQVVQENKYFAHPESILITMLGEDNEAVQHKGESQELHFIRTTLQFICFTFQP